MSLESPRLPLEEWGCDGEDRQAECAPLRGIEARLQEARKRGAQGLRLDAGECDPFHVYWDTGSSRLESWRD